MKREQFTQTFKEFVEAGNNPNAYYVTYRHNENIRSQRWGKVYADGIEPILDEIEQNAEIVQGELPIERLIIYAQEQCLVFLENKLWDCVNNESEDSHIVECVPFISREGQFGTIADLSDNPFNITKDDLVGELVSIPLGVVVKMAERQQEQQKKVDLKVFADNLLVERLGGGFDWKLTREGYDFWSWVLIDRKFEEVFYKKYPQYRKYDR